MIADKFTVLCRREYWQFICEWPMMDFGQLLTEMGRNRARVVRRF